MEIRFSQSARKHRIGKQRALSVIDASEPVEYLVEGSNPPRMMWIGFDDRGLEFEILAVKTATYLLVIHVMPYKFRRGK